MTKGAHEENLKCQSGISSFSAFASLGKSDTAMQSQIVAAS
jgi:hypothetical protein